MKTLIMATNNAHKLREIRQILGDEYEVKGLADIGCLVDIPETADTLEGNALQKARYVHEHYGVDCFADDTGLEVDALGGAPGVYTARWGSMHGYGDSHDTEANIDCLIDQLKDATQRTARFRTVIALVRQGQEHLFEGIVNGELLRQRTGGEGFGYDPIFAPTEAGGKSFAQMGPEGKNAISHRARATKKLADFLRQLAILLLVWLMPSIAAAQSLGHWQYYRSYQYASQCAIADKVVYAHYAGNLLSYDTEDGELRTFDRLTGLNGTTITHLAYSPAAKRLIAVYDDCGIDLIDADGSVQYLAALKDKDLSGKNINHVTIDGTQAYLAMGFGLVVMDVREGVFRNTYRLGQDVLSAVCLDGAYYLATKDGLLSARTSDNLFDITSWQKVASGNWTNLFPSGTSLIGRVGGVVHFFTPGGTPTRAANGQASAVFDAGDAVVWTNQDKTFLCPKGTTDVQALSIGQQHGTWQHAQIRGNNCWACEGDGGLCGYTLKQGTLTPTGAPIRVDSPKRDLAYQLVWAGDRLLISGGRNDVEMGNIEGLNMYLEQGKWTTLQEMEKPADKPLFNLYNSTDLIQDPADEQHHFASFYRKGLCEYRSGKFVKLWDNTNSSLASILPGAKDEYNYVSCSGVQYDDDGNLWMLCSMTSDIVKLRTAAGKWYSLHYNEVDKASLCDKILLHSSGIRFFNARWNSPRGIFAFDTKQTLTNVNDDRHRLRSTITNQDGTTYAPDYFYTLTEDLDGRIWCATDLGPFVINDANEFFNDDFRFEQVKVARNDGSGLADYLLSGVSISCIAVDGGNRKWIGTHTNGVYLISADGQEMVHHFTTADSPLLSNSINDIAVHPITGQVMIATTKGLCSYGGDATQAMDELEGSNVLAYPNPVGPDHTGPIAVRGLTMDSEVKILSSTGQLVWSGVSHGGMFTWDGCRANGSRVASGIYHVVASTKEGNKAIVTRIVIVR